MQELSEPIKSFFHLYCHVEDYGIYELHKAVKAPTWTVDIFTIKKQIIEILENPAEYMESIHKLTGNEFDTHKELKEWLITIKNVILSV